MPLTATERRDLALRMSAESDQRFLDAETAKREGRDHAALELLGEAQGWISAGRMILEDAA